MPGQDAAKAFGMVLVILITIVIGVMIYYNVATLDELDSITERFTSLSNATDSNWTLVYKPNSGAAADFSGTYYNKSSSAWGTLTASLYTLDEGSLRLKTNTGGKDGLNMSAVNVTYYTSAGALNRDSIGTTAGSVWTIAPIIAVVIIAGIILAVVTGFGRKNI